MTRVAALVTLLAFTGGCTGAPTAGDEHPHAQYDPQTGRLARLMFSSSGTGRNDAVGVMDGTRIHRIELDENHDGRTDRWEFYDANHRMVSVGVSRGNDGVMDAVMFHAPDGSVSRVAVSTRRDGRFDRVEFYASGAIARVEEDTDGDTKTDKWESYRLEPSGTTATSSVAAVAFDDDGRGTPGRRLVFGSNGRVIRVELDPERDGTFTEQKP